MILETILGIGICASLIIFFASLWDKKEHFLLRLLASFFFLYLLILIPKVIVDNKDTCKVVVANETVTGNFTAFEYMNKCITTTTTTHTIFYDIITWFWRLFILYIFLYFLYVTYLKSRLLDWGVMKR